MAYNNLYAKNQLMAVLLENKKLKSRIIELSNDSKIDLLNQNFDNHQNNLNNNELTTIKNQLNAEKENTNKVNNELISLKNQLNLEKENTNNVNNQLTTVKNQLNVEKENMQKVTNELTIIKNQLNLEKEQYENLKNENNELLKNGSNNNMIMEVKSNVEEELKKKYDIKCKECEILEKGKDAYSQKNNILTKIQNDQKKEIERLNIELREKEATHQKEIDRISLENAKLIKEFSGSGQPEIIE